MVGTVASLLVLINTQGLANWTGLPACQLARLDYEGDFFGCPDGSHRTGGNGGKLSWVESYASQDGYC